MSESNHPADPIPALEAYLERASAVELARRSLVGAPVYTLISLIMLAGTPILRNYGWWALAEALLLLSLGGVRVWFALGFERRYHRIGERAVMQFNVLTAMQSLTLGVLAAIVTWYYWAAQEVVLTIVLSAGCIAAGTSALSVRRSAHLIFLVCVLAPFGVAVYLVGGAVKALLILGFLALMAFLVQDGGQARQTYMRQLQDHYDDQVTRLRTAVESRAQKEFLGNIGREIRAQLNSIMGMTELLQDAELDRRARQHIEIIRNSGRALVRLIDNIPGSVARRINEAETKLGSLDLRECIEKVMELYRHDADIKGLDLTASYANLPGTVMFSDENHLEQVLVNLLSNAVANTDEGSITVTAACESLDEGDLSIGISVADTGVGIPPESLNSIFDPFNVRGARTSGKFAGSGLGLPLCQGLVEVMGGEIRLESIVGQGTTVSFTIPAQFDPADDSWPVASEGVVQSGPDEARDLAHDHPHRILIVEDDEIHREILSGFLQALGYPVDEVEDGQQAIAAVMEGAYDLIFMDLHMPVMDGLEATRWIREHFDRKRGGGVQIVALTGDAMQETRQRCLGAGMDNFVPKPARTRDLEEILRDSAGDRPLQFTPDYKVH